MHQFSSLFNLNPYKDIFQFLHTARSSIYYLSYISDFPLDIFLHFDKFSDPSRVVYTPTIQYLPLHLSGIIHCHIESHPPFQFITWTKDKRIFDPFEMEEIQTLTNGSLLITKVKRRKIFQYTLHVFCVVRCIS